MVPSTFTGSSRPRRQVNLSGRTNNPFANVGNRSSSSPAQNAIAHAQQERIQRQRERERPPAATTIQRVWRGHRERSVTKDRWRKEWDAVESQQTGRESYGSESLCLHQLQLLVQFASPSEQSDIVRLSRFTEKFLSARSRGEILRWKLSEAWIAPLTMFARLTIRAIIEFGADNPTLVPFDHFLDLFVDLAYIIPDRISGSDYYKALLVAVDSWSRTSSYNARRVEKAVCALLESNSASTTPRRITKPNYKGSYAVYTGFAWCFLSSSTISSAIDLNKLIGLVHFLTLTTAIGDGISRLSVLSRQEVLWLLAHYIYFGRRSTRGASYVEVISKLISYCAADIESRMHVSKRFDTSDEEPLPHFVEEQLLSLIDQDSVARLINFLEDSPGSKESDAPQQASSLATYVLTLLRVFPRRAGDIRMWLFRGDSRKQSDRGKLPAVKFFYESIRRSAVFRSISREPKESIHLLKPDFDPEISTSKKLENGMETRAREWRVILLFMELYKFVLLIMDDEEFLSGSLPANEGQSETRQSALPVDQIAELVKFLKHLAFSMYWNGPEITGIQKEQSQDGLSHYFSAKSQHRPIQQAVPTERHVEPALAGMPGMTLTHLKGMVTGLLRMLYERDSRRKFLPNGYWLMTQYFEMERFIAAVVEEEEAKKSIGDSDPQSQEVVDPQYEDEDEDEETLIGTSRTQRLRHAERLREKQQQMARKRDLDLITPRLEIMQNMPFFIPFATRVQIFRQFVRNEQRERRGYEDPDDWRFAMMQAHAHDMSKHKATVRRESIFDDAFEQFYDLKEALKEPIQIKFVDKFGTEEEGIDGGGVTKEFLTSVTSEAFSSNSDNLDLFIENDQHLLFPNPSAIDERRDLLTQAGLRESDPEWTKSIRDLLQRYEFLGRIIGKCMYESILVDVPFAGFFLLKWALTGGSGAASRETSYRANLNDLRDLDEGLYQGLLQLKNHPGNVDDFSLNFTIEDAIEQRRRPDPSPSAPTSSRNRTVTRELRPNGASISVTNENRLVYITLVARHRLQHQPHRQTSAFLRGLGTIVSPAWLSMFNQSELQTLISGSRTEIDIADLRRNTQYGGVYAIGDDGLEHPTILHFWKALELMSDGDRRKVLKFVTSTPRAPLLGFDQLNPRFSIRDSGSDQRRLPTTSTCVNLLKLPIYRSLGVLKERLLYSVNAGAGFNLS